MREVHKQELESQIDTYGLQEVLQEISEICHLKGWHLRANWQDLTAAKVWERAADNLATCSNRPAIVEVS